MTFVASTPGPRAAAAPLPHRATVKGTLLSWLIAVAVACGALRLALCPRLTPALLGYGVPRQGLAALGVGLGFAGVHSTAMAAGVPAQALEDSGLLAGARPLCAFVHAADGFVAEASRSFARQGA